MGVRSIGEKVPAPASFLARKCVSRIDLCGTGHHLCDGLEEEAIGSKSMTWSAATSQFDSALSPARRLSRLKKIAWAVDGVFRIPGTRFRFGLNSLIGATPAAGDIILAGISLYIVNEARLLGIPSDKIARMLANVGIEVAAGAVPILGDFFDMGFKANLRNLAIIEEHMRASALHL